MEVRLEPTTVKREEFGTMVGSGRDRFGIPDNAARHGGLFCTTFDSLVTRLAHEGRRALRGRGAPCNRTTRPSSGYRWAVGSGPPLRLTSGTLDARRRLRRDDNAALDLVVPMLKKLSGITG